ncbi:hypothetical protein ONZ45_g7873 [Pleurotus djamor]|nr:hypothetical protein ONZ45_g7873 [Pleurotus djamor]
MATEPSETSPSNIPRINTDILYHIFYQLNDAHHVDWNEFKGEGLPLSWVQITGVCREWRDVAISHADLWTCIDLNAHELAMTMIDRARDKPLRLYYRYPRYDPTDPSPSPSSQDIAIWALMMGPMLPRVEEIYASNVSESTLFCQLFGPAQITAPILKSFRLFHDTTAALTTGDRVTCVPFEFLYWSMPMLDHLELQGFVHAIWWDPICLPNLGHLDLSTPDGLTLEVNSPELVRTLGHMPHLHTMTLKNVQLDPWDIGPMPPAELPELKSLSIHARHTKILRLLHYIRYPPTAEVSIKCFDIHDQTVELLLGAVLSNRAIMSSKPSRVVTSIGTAFHLKTFHDGDDDPLFEISLEHQRGINQPYFPLDTFSELLQILKPKEFACAVTLGFQSATIQEWVDFFQPFGSDCQLALTCCCPTALPNIIRALSRLPASDHLRSVMLAPSALRVFYPGHGVISESQGTPALVTCLYELFTSPDSSYHIAFEPKMSTIAKEIARTLKELLNDENLKSEEVQGFMSLVYGKDVGMLPERTLPDRLVALALSFLLWS